MNLATSLPVIQYSETYPMSVVNDSGLREDFGSMTFSVTDSGLNYNLVITNKDIYNQIKADTAQKANMDKLIEDFRKVFSAKAVEYGYYTTL